MVLADHDLAQIIGDPRTDVSPKLRVRKSGCAVTMSWEFVVALGGIAQKRLIFA